MAEKFFGSLQHLREKIRGDINNFENPYKVLLDVAKIVGEISGEENFYHEIRELIISRYGNILQDKPALEIELDEVSKRREKIFAALSSDEFTDEEKRRIQFALNRHDKEIERLKKILANSH